MNEWQKQQWCEVYEKAIELGATYEEAVRQADDWLADMLGNEIDSIYDREREIH